jgi:alkanesulfonate monooxygenase SsuD/methylene tetrahydromethanopterin reductase-like flavin-dependent oxidoreductase (luciferase family)
MHLAARYADIWSGYATETSLPPAFEPMLAQLDEACREVGRDPSTIGRSIGVWVEPTDEHGAEADDLGVPITGSASEIADTIRTYAAMGLTRLELMLWPLTLGAVAAMAPVLADLDGRARLA